MIASSIGYRLTKLFKGHTNEIYRLEWSNLGGMLATPAADGTIRLWQMTTEQPARCLEVPTHPIYCVSWSPDDKKLASVSADGAVRIWEVASGKLLHTFPTEPKAFYSIAWSPMGDRLAVAHDKAVWLWEIERAEACADVEISVCLRLDGHKQAVYCVAWSPDGRRLASGSQDRTILVWDSVTGEALRTLTGHEGTLYTLAFSPDGLTLASGGEDNTIRVWDVEGGKQKFSIAGHTRHVNAVAFSHDGRLLASKSGDNTSRLWRTDTWETLAFMESQRATPSAFLTSLAFHPNQSLLATLSEDDTAVQLWEFDTDALLAKVPEVPSIHYTNAKIVLVGDTGVGKSALCKALVGKDYEETDSTHSRRVHLLEMQTIRVEPSVEEIREILLWDMAGQPGYRLIHQLHLHEVSVALIVFDARHELDPFSGVMHWARALRQAAQFSRKPHPMPMKIFLVAARVDRGGIGVSRRRIDAMLETFQLDGYFETSSREGQHIEEVRQAVLGAIAWDALPRVSSDQLLKTVKTFLEVERTNGHQLSTVDDLYFSFLRTPGVPTPQPTDLRAQFTTCIGMLESKGLLVRLSFGDYVLLQPELLDAYGSALVNAAKNEPDGLGFINEDDARQGKFPLSPDERLKNPEREKLLLIATIESLLRHEIALRTQERDESYIVFPTQITREVDNPPPLNGPSVIFKFEGPIANIYATLIVRLSRSGFFKLQEMWHNAATFTAMVGGVCGVQLDNLGEGVAELSVFFDKAASEYSRFQFEEFVHAHLYKRALPDTVRKEWVLACPECETPIANAVVQARKARRFDWLDCPVCGTRISIPDPKRRSVVATVEVVSGMDKNADTYRDRDAAASIVNGKAALGEFDVFLSHNSQDKLAVRQIADQLEGRAIRPWLDERQLRPGLPWQKTLEQHIKHIKSVAVFVGKNGIGPWQDVEQNAFIREFVKRDLPVIPVILPDCQQTPTLPLFLTGMTWVDFRKSAPDPLEQLLWGITGRRDQPTPATP